MREMKRTLNKSSICWQILYNQLQPLPGHRLALIPTSLQGHVQSAIKRDIRLLIALMYVTRDRETSLSVRSSADLLGLAMDN